MNAGDHHGVARAKGREAGTTRAATRRWRYGICALGVVVCAAISLALVNLIALDPRLRLAADVTSTGEHRLAPRTRQVLESLPPGYEVVISGAGVTDRDVRRRVGDVLDTMARTGRVGVTWIDDPSGPEYAALIDRLIERDRGAIERLAQQLGSMADEIERAAGRLGEYDQALKAIEAQFPPGGPGSPRATVQGYAAIARNLATDMRTAAESIRSTIGQPSALGVPPLDRAISMTRRALERLSGDLQSLSTALVGLAGDGATPSNAQMQARTLAQQVRLARDPIAVLSEQATGLIVPDLVRVSRVLEGVQSVLVISPTGLGAVSFEMVFPESIPETVGGARADVGAKAEDLITSAISSLASPTSPIVVLVHADDRRLLEQNLVGQLQARLALRRIDMLEWRVVAEPEAPSLAAVDPTGSRPVVYALIGTSSATQASGSSNLGGVERAQRLGAAARRLIDRGESLLVSATPSTMPGFGSPDAATSFLSEFGLRVDSGHPLLSERLVNGRRVVDTDRLVTSVETPAGEAAEGAASPGKEIAEATRSLALGVIWALPLERVDPPAGVRATVTPLVEVDAPQTWGESQWLHFWQIPPEQRAIAPQAPTPDERSGDDVTGPWTIAAAAERSAPGLGGPQRIVVVGSNGWFFDAIAAQTEVVNGRVALSLPGNAELFEASVSWLAGQEGLIARSAASGSVPTVRALSEGQLTLIRWLVLGGLPLATLGAGLVWRWLKG